MDSSRIQNKIKLLFAKLAEPDYVMNNYYVEGFINRLSNHSDPEISFLDKLPLLSDLIIEALDRTENAHNTVKVFLIRVLAIVSQKELHFAKVCLSQGTRILAGFKQFCLPYANPSVKVAYTELALAIVKHNSGISWILETGVWKEILNLNNERATVFIIRQKNNFMAEFLWKLNDLGDATNIKLVLECLMEPLSSIDLMNVESLTSEDEVEICQLIEPSMQTLLCVVSKDNRIQNTTLLMNILLIEYKFHPYLCIACKRLRSENTVLLLATLIFWLNLAKVFLLKPLLPDVQYSGEEFLTVAAANFNIIQSFIQRRSAILVLDFCSACNIVWHTVCKDKEPNMWMTNANNKIQIKNQMLFMCLVPLLYLTKKKSPEYLGDLKINDYITRFMNSSCEHAAKAVYSLKELITELDTMAIMLQSAKKLIHLKEYLNDEQANLVFQAMFYVLQEYSIIDVNLDVKQEESFEDREEIDLIMMYVLDIVLSLVTHRNINWHESVEIICLYNVVSNILRKPNLTCKFIVKALNVITLTVKKFLPPNLSLLMESKPGTAIHDLGKLIYMKMHDRNWEIRDTALELCQICTDICFIKFPPFQKQILDNNLINVAATIAFNDHESYVQVSALKCIGASSRVGPLWDKLILEHPDIQERLLYILRYNEEGIVRKEASNVLCDLYKHMRLNSAFKEKLYEHMVSSALTDCHWEVQVSALKFWKIVYQSLLTDQGMLDGQFPPVTFSKGTRKIVTLNEPEIQKRLLKILDTLAAIGCLAVFVKLLHDDTELAIMDVALTIAQELYDILNRYKIQDCLNPDAVDISDVEEVLYHIKEEIDDDSNINMPDVQSPDNVIESILNANDINLLANIYEQRMTLQANKEEVPLRPKMKLTKVVSPYLFVNYLKNSDFKAIIDEKRKWNEGIRSISSLLDDVLGIYDINSDEINSPDCY